MSGVPFRVDGRGRVFISWMSRNRVYWSVSDDGATAFAPRIPTPDQDKSEAYPTVVVNPKGQVLLVWKQGKQVNWAKYQTDGKYTGERGTAGEMSGNDKPNAFAGAEGDFYIVF